MFETKALVFAASSCKYTSEGSGPNPPVSVAVANNLAPGALPRNCFSTGGITEPEALLTVRRLLAVPGNNPRHVRPVPSYIHPRSRKQGTGVE